MLFVDLRDGPQPGKIADYEQIARWGHYGSRRNVTHQHGAGGRCAHGNQVSLVAVVGAAVVRIFRRDPQKFHEVVAGDSVRLKWHTFGLNLLKT